MITESSYFFYNNDNIFHKIGRDYVHSDIGKISGLLFSSFSPSQDHILFGFKKNKINGRFILSKLNNEKISCDDLAGDCNNLENFIIMIFY